MYIDPCDKQKTALIVLNAAATADGVILVLDVVSLLHGRKFSINYVFASSWQLQNSNVQI